MAATVAVVLLWTFGLGGWAWLDRRARRRFESEVRAYDE